MSFIDNIQRRFKQGTIVEKLIYINIAILILAYLFNTFNYLFESNNNLISNWLVLPANLNDFLSKPWTIITYGFVHFDFFHILFNLIALFFIGNLFIEYFTQKQLLSFYILGTLFGGIIFILSYNYFPVFVKSTDRNLLLGASAGVSAILIGIATYLPNYQFKIPLIGFIKLWHIGLFWVLKDVIQIPMGNAGGHFAHLGGALFGFLYVTQASNKKVDILSKLSTLFKSKDKPLKTVYKSKSKTNPIVKNSSVNQQKIDGILDKISKSGYDTLTKTEKEFLFKQGKR